MDRRRGHALQDAALAAVVGGLGLAETWVPFESVFGVGSPVVSTVGIVAAAALLSQRRLRPAASIGVFVVWLALGVATLGELHALFFGQIVPFMVALYSLARHGAPRVAWSGAASAALTLVFADLSMPVLQSFDEIVFHWTVLAVAFAVGWGLRTSEDRAIAAAVRASEAEARSRERTIAAIADERARIARELHDVLAHSVSMMVVQAGAAAEVVEDDPAFARRALESIRATGTESLDEVRRVVSILRAPDDAAGLDPQPGIAGLHGLVEEVRAAGIAVDLAVTGDVEAVPPGLALAVYRIAQESLTNVRKHADATAATVRVECGSDAITVAVIDDGRRTAEQVLEPGHGIIGMRERAGVYGGRLDARRTPDGFAVHAVLPWAAT
ncbi:histidine kinase [Xylanimonas cellulosilytica DSM 15894]|uniref:histidine kinase n=1 Tax=Xylanimonas cellulosilytica (strain DSM 15894 / JCM 12276 / CECT 5975 / KCTC 9989 / LMG 20990 / NBRC 107835 / XIL07) TaxID=446471 RepID=D1BSG5_XYLCX|nr:sensor histidine kinase [Xylanimonas cellulosilytica]ACZ30657.1 histidine kinase [Xylanimonas cellulosilytica DSM 15894]